MPTAYGAVLQRVPAAMMTPSGLFGRGSEWREGATLVLTIHGYLHLFLPDPKAKKTTENSPEAGTATKSLLEALLIMGSSMNEFDFDEIQEVPTFQIS